MHCLLCHEKIPRLRAWRTKSEFCCDEHAALYKKQTLERLLTDQGGPAPSEKAPALPVEPPPEPQPELEAPADGGPRALPSGLEPPEPDLDLDLEEPAAAQGGFDEDDDESFGDHTDFDDLWRMADEVADLDSDPNAFALPEIDHAPGVAMDDGRNGYQPADEGDVNTQSAEEALAALRALAGKAPGDEDGDDVASPDELPELPADDDFSALEAQLLEGLDSELDEEIELQDDPAPDVASSDADHSVENAERSVEEELESVFSPPTPEPDPEPRESSPAPSERQEEDEPSILERLMEQPLAEWPGPRQEASRESLDEAEIDEPPELGDWPDEEPDEQESATERTAAASTESSEHWTDLELSLPDDLDVFAAADGEPADGDADEEVAESPAAHDDDDDLESPDRLEIEAEGEAGVEVADAPDAALDVSDGEEAERAAVEGALSDAEGDDRKSDREKVVPFPGPRPEDSVARPVDCEDIERQLDERPVDAPPDEAAAAANGVSTSKSPAPRTTRQSPRFRPRMVMAALHPDAREPDGGEPPAEHWRDAAAAAAWGDARQPRPLLALDDERPTLLRRTLPRVSIGAELQCRTGLYFLSGEPADPPAAGEPPRKTCDELAPDFDVRLPQTAALGSPARSRPAYRCADGALPLYPDPRTEAPSEGWSAAAAGVAPPMEAAPPQGLFFSTPPPEGGFGAGAAELYELSESGEIEEGLLHLGDDWLDGAAVGADDSSNKIGEYR